MNSLRETLRLVFKTQVFDDISTKLVANITLDATFFAISNNQIKNHCKDELELNP
jgi:hypothetical protein